MMIPFLKITSFNSTGLLSFTWLDCYYHNDFLVISLVAFTITRIISRMEMLTKRELIILTARANYLEESMEAKDWFIKESWRCACR